MFYKSKLFILSAVLLVSGCANIKTMPLSKTTTTIDLSQQSILVVGVSVKNNNANFRPSLSYVNIGEGEEILKFHKPIVLSKDSNSGSYIASVQVDPGTQNLDSIETFTNALLVKGSGKIPFKQTINVPAGKIAYLGNINAVINKRENDTQPRAGSLIPLIDQAVTGYSGGTWEVNVTDKFEEDMEELYSILPFLKSKEVVKMVLPSWEYPTKD